MTFKQVLVGGLVGVGAIGTMLLRIPRQEQAVLFKAPLQLSSKISVRFMKTLPARTRSDKRSEKTTH